MFVLEWLPITAMFQNNIGHTPQNSDDDYCQAINYNEPEDGDWGMMDGWQ